MESTVTYLLDYKKLNPIYVSLHNEAPFRETRLTGTGDFLRILTEIEGLYLLCDEQKGQLSH